MPGLENPPELETGFLKKQRAQFLHFPGSVFSVWSIQQRKSEHMVLWEASCPRWSLVAASWNTQFRWFSRAVSLGLLPTAGGGLERGFWLPRTGLRRPVCWVLTNQYYQIIKASLVAQTVESLPAMQVSKCKWTARSRVWRYVTRTAGGFFTSWATREAGDLGLIPGSGRSPGEGNGRPLQYSCLGNHMDRGAWQATSHGVAKSRTRLSDWHTQ